MALNYNDYTALLNLGKGSAVQGPTGTIDGTPEFGSNEAYQWLINNDYGDIWSDGNKASELNTNFLNQLKTMPGWENTSGVDYINGKLRAITGSGDSRQTRSILMNPDGTMQGSRWLAKPQESFSDSMKNFGLLAGAAIGGLGLVGAGPASGLNGLFSGTGAGTATGGSGLTLGTGTTGLQVGAGSGLTTGLGSTGLGSSVGAGAGTTLGTAGSGLTLGAGGATAGAGAVSGLGTLLNNVTNATGNSTVRNIIGSVLGGGNSGGNTGGNSGGNGINGLTDIINMLTNGTMYNKFDNLQDEIKQIYSPEGAYAKTLENRLARQDAASGRNSQYGPRLAQLMGSLGDSHARALQGLGGMMSNQAPFLNGVGGSTNRVLETGLNGLFDLIKNSGSGAGNALDNIDWDNWMDIDFGLGN